MQSITITPETAILETVRDVREHVAEIRKTYREKSVPKEAAIIAERDIYRHGFDHLGHILTRGERHPHFHLGALLSPEHSRVEDLLFDRWREIHKAIQDTPHTKDASQAKYRLRRYFVFGAQIALSPLRRKNGAKVEIQDCSCKIPGTEGYDKSPATERYDQYCR